MSDDKTVLEYNHRLTDKKRDIDVYNANLVVSSDLNQNSHKKAKPAFQKVVRGTITRLYPSDDRLYFHVSGDQSPRGFTDSDYNFILNTAPHFQTTYQLLLKAAEHQWIVVVRRSDSMERHRRINATWIHYNVDYVSVDF